MTPSASPLLLALDTSTRVASVALFDGELVLSETTWLAGREHSTRVLVEVQAALLRVARTTQHLTGLVVARGPGSFTGVRVAISVAKGISAGLSLPLWGISSLDVLAHAAGQVDLPVRAVLEAGRGRFATGVYLRGRSSGEPRLATLDELDDLIRVATLVIGELPEAARARLEQNVFARLATRAACLRRGGFLAELGWQRALAGEPGDPHVLEALYVS
ncbi:MAG: tRNA (adenosine(37)-N6)-threonylcarbamoyltransferase complex dimerization subunit type 1 TsaB [Chloroflexota bacterium]|nr:tRNA (adenosine(37)-N6)-threonylcarbamoyltransferase complex dimerization subunit type 1 TsaB [Chloroflexota bacterium]